MNFFDQNSAPAISGILAKYAFRIFPTERKSVRMENAYAISPQARRDIYDKPSLLKTSLIPTAKPAAKHQTNSPVEKVGHKSSGHENSSSTVL